MARKKPETGLNLPFIGYVFVLHIAAILIALFHFSWDGVIACMILHAVTGIGITLGYHRMFAHGSFRAIKPLEYLIGFCGAAANQGGPISWVGTHKRHHAYSDKEGDPHSPFVSPYRDRWWAQNWIWKFLWSHIIWMFFQRMKENDRLAPGNMRKDRFYRFLNRHQFLPQVLIGVPLYLIGGWVFVGWGIIVRIVLLWHCTWLVNSATHIFGYRSFEADGDHSRNNPVVAVLTYGEGWHNNHHEFQRSAKTGFRWWELDPTWYLLFVLEQVRLIRINWKDIPSKKVLRERRYIRSTA